MTITLTKTKLGEVVSGVGFKIATAVLACIPIVVLAVVIIRWMKPKRRKRK